MCLDAYGSLIVAAGALRASSQVVLLHLRVNIGSPAAAVNLNASPCPFFYTLIFHLEPTMQEKKNHLK